MENSLSSSRPPSPPPQPSPPPHGGAAAAILHLHQQHPPSGRLSRTSNGSSRSIQHTYYRPAALFSIRPDVIHGFHVLLSSPEADPTVAYYSILDGNILPMLLGVTPTPPFIPRALLPAMARTRNYLAGFAGDERKEREIVYGYATIFRTLDEHHRELQAGPCEDWWDWGGEDGGRREGGLCVWCWAPCRFVRLKLCCGEGRMRRRVLRVVEDAFEAMEKELEAW